MNQMEIGKLEKDKQLNEKQNNKNLEYRAGTKDQ
jgi:hypothetical protein